MCQGVLLINAKDPSGTKEKKGTRKDVRGSHSGKLEKGSEDWCRRTGVGGTEKTRQGAEGRKVFIFVLSVKDHRLLAGVSDCLTA